MDKSDLLRNVLKRNRRVLAVAALVAALAYAFQDSLFDPAARALGGIALVFYGALLVRLYRKTPFFWRAKARSAADWSLTPTEAELERVTEQTRRTHGPILRSSVSGKRLLLATVVAGAPAAWLLLSGRPVNFLPLWILGWVLYEFAPIDRVKATEIGLIFRRFSTSVESDQFCINVADATKGLCCFFTIQDQSYPGDGSIKRHALAYLLVIFALPQFLVLLLFKEYGPTLAFSVFIIEWFALEFHRSRDFAPIDIEMTSARIDDYVSRVKHRRWHDNGVHTMRFTDRAWQSAILYALPRAATALISIDSRFMNGTRTENRHLLWEIDQVLKTVPPSRVIFIWSALEPTEVAEARPSVSMLLETLKEFTGAAIPDLVLKARFVGFSPEDDTRAPPMDLPKSETRLRLTVAAAVASRGDA